MNDDFQVDEKLIEAFHLMFDHFPEGVQLAHKSKRVVALNAACKSLGREVGMILRQARPGGGAQGLFGPQDHQKPCGVLEKGRRTRPRRAGSCGLLAACGRLPGLLHPFWRRLHEGLFPAVRHGIARQQ